MKIYKFEQIKRLALDEGFKYASLEDQDGRKLLPYNINKNKVVKLEAHFALIKKKLDSEILDEGIYCVCCANAPNQTQDPTRFYIQKGTGATVEQNPTIVIREKNNSRGESVLSWQQAIENNDIIARLTIEKKFLTEKNNELGAYVKELEAELEISKSKELAEKIPESSTSKFLNEIAPSIPSILDRYFDLEERKLTKGNPVNKKINQSFKKPLRMFKTGSEEHLVHIEKLYTDGNEEKFNEQLDRIEKSNTEIYNQLLVKYNLVEEEEEEEKEKEETKN